MVFSYGDHVSAERGVDMEWDSGWGNVGKFRERKCRSDWQNSMQNFQSFAQNSLGHNSRAFLITELSDDVYIEREQSTSSLSLCA